MLVVAYTAGQWREIATYFSRRNARYGAHRQHQRDRRPADSRRGQLLSGRENKRWDLTENKQYSLVGSVGEAAEGLDAPVKFVVFDQPQNFDSYRGRLNGYSYYSKQVAIDYVDPAKDMIQAKQYNVDQYGTIAVAYKDRVERATSNTSRTSPTR